METGPKNRAEKKVKKMEASWYLVGVPTLWDFLNEKDRRISRGKTKLMIMNREKKRDKNRDRNSTPWKTDDSTREKEKRWIEKMSSSTRTGQLPIKTKREKRINGGKRISKDILHTIKKRTPRPLVPG